MLLIAVGSGPRPAWLYVIVYLTVVVTVLSGADYFFGLRRLGRSVEPRTTGGVRQ